jgi:DNA-binding transcriptional MerR regulator/effector-binding domain-containing protein
MKILVSDLARLYGITSQTLHYYEAKKILCPQRDFINNYRYYKLSDLKLIGSIKKYRNAGFSLQDTLSICDSDNECDIISKYHKQKELLEKEIEKKQLTINQFNEDLSLHLRYKEKGNTFFVEELEGFLMFESPDKEIIFQNQPMTTEAIPWFENIFFTRASRTFYIDNNTKKICRNTYGMLASVSNASFLNLNITENVKEIEGGTFVTSIINTNYDKDVEKVIYDCMDYINDKNYKMRGNPFDKTIFVYKNENSEYKLLKQILVPVDI